MKTTPITAWRNLGREVRQVNDFMHQKTSVAKKNFRYNSSQNKKQTCGVWRESFGLLLSLIKK